MYKEKFENLTCKNFIHENVFLESKTQVFNFR